MYPREFDVVFLLPIVYRYPHPPLSKIEKETD